MSPTWHDQDFVRILFPQARNQDGRPTSVGTHILKMKELYSANLVVFYDGEVWKSQDSQYHRRKKIDKAVFKLNPKGDFQTVNPIPSDRVFRMILVKKAYLGDPWSLKDLLSEEEIGKTDLIVSYNGWIIQDKNLIIRNRITGIPLGSLTFKFNDRPPL